MKAALIIIGIIIGSLGAFQYAVNASFQKEEFPDPIPHLCIDETHEYCDGYCDCDGMDCYTFRPELKDSLIMDETYESNNMPGYVYTYNDKIAKMYQEDGKPTVHIDNGVFWIKVK